MKAGTRCGYRFLRPLSIFHTGMVRRFGMENGLAAGWPLFGRIVPGQARSKDLA